MSHQFNVKFHAISNKMCKSDSLFVSHFQISNVILNFVWSKMQNLRNPKGKLSSGHDFH